MPRLHQGLSLWRLLLLVLMSATRVYRDFAYRDAAFRILSDAYDSATREIIARRNELEAYIRSFPLFRTSLAPLELTGSPPESARRMAHAAGQVGVGPMAAVAGTMAQLAAEAAIRAGATESIVENGGDIYLHIAAPLTVALYAGKTPLAGQLAFAVTPDDGPMAVCSSSSHMGHSMSLGACDLATVVARDAALADAAATQAANLVLSPDDLSATAERIAAIEGIEGLLLVKGEHIALAGVLPELVRAG